MQLPFLTTTHLLLSTFLTTASASWTDYGYPPNANSCLNIADLQSGCGPQPTMLEQISCRCTNTNNFNGRAASCMKKNDPTHETDLKLVWNLFFSACKANGYPLQDYYGRNAFLDGRGDGGRSGVASSSTMSSPTSSAGPSQTSTSPAENVGSKTDSGGSHTSTGAIVGIIVGIVGAIATIATLFVPCSPCYVKRLVKAQKVENVREEGRPAQIPMVRHGHGVRGMERDGWYRAV